MRLIIVSGRSGSGKSTALAVLEDAGFNCIDNLPAILLKPLVEETLHSSHSNGTGLAICIDARNNSLTKFTELFDEIDRTKINCELVFFDALDETLLKRFSETQRPHPLTNKSRDLQEAIKLENKFLDKVSEKADLRIDTSALTERELRNLVTDRIIQKRANALNLAFCSFGYKHGVPRDADYVFDMRCLPNPFWSKTLKNFTGLDEEVKSFLSEQDLVKEMLQDLIFYLDKWINRFENHNKLYMTVAIGCTGGQHRSVYVVEKLAEYFTQNSMNVIVRHREL